MKQRNRNLIIILLAAAAAIFAVSFFTANQSRRMKSEIPKVERRLHRREAILDGFTAGILEGTEELADNHDLPEDMVIYHYRNDSLHCWVNQFPIGNDDIRARFSVYNLHHLMWTDVATATPLAYIPEGESYVNLGSGWYFVKVHTSGNERLISAIHIKDEYSLENLSYANKTNDYLRIDRKYTTVPLSYDSSAIVHSKSGQPLFSVVSTSRTGYIQHEYVLHWLVILLILIAAVVYLSSTRTWHSYNLFATVAVLLAVWARSLSHISDQSHPLFSPLTYAGSQLFDSLANLFICNLLVTLLVLGLIPIRASMLAWYKGLKKRGRVLCALLAVGVSAFVAIYIHLTLSSLIFNSNVSMNLSRLTSISIYSILCYISFGGLFLTMLHCVQYMVTSIAGRHAMNVFKWRNILIYLVLISAYTLAVVEITGVRKDFDTNKVLTDRLAIDRDLSLEMHLRMIENGIRNDQIIATLSFWPDGGAEIIRNRILERYLFRSISSKYNISVTTCSPSNQLIIDRNTPAVNCNQFFRDETERYGSQLSPGSAFHYMNRYNGHSSYIGVFSYVNFNTYQTTNLYIEFVPNPMADATPDAFITTGSSKSQSSSIPRFYSYARYVDGRLVSSSGRTTFTSTINPADYKSGYHMSRKGHYIQFINKVSDDEIIILSRPGSRFGRNLVFFSYVSLLFGVILIPSTSRFRKGSLFTLPGKSYKRKITVVMVLSLLLSLACVAFGTISFTLRRNRSGNERRMVNMMQIVKSTLSDYCQYALKYNDMNMPPMLDAMESISNSTSYDINIYDRFGKLAGTTQPDVYSQSILGTRMDHEAYNAIVQKHSMNYIGHERIAGDNVSSIYAPLFNIDGDLVAIANIPYITGSSQFQEEGSLIIASIINLYILIMIAGIILSMLLANSISKPLSQIRSSMERLPASKQKEHLVYRNTKDELGMLVSAYNKMLDDLEESTRQLARSEREQAWKEMARQIAHEIKNPLTPMQLSIQHVQRLKKNNAPGWENELDKVCSSLLEQIDILSNTASTFSTFSKLLSNEAVSRENLVEILKDELVLFNSQENIEVKFETELTDAFVNIRKQQIVRGFVNLISNATQAIGRGQEGRIGIFLTRSGDMYRVSVEDNGPGVKESDVERLFSPDFTTKISGNGLGLAICKDIVERNEGRIYYERSAALGGASFVIELPAAGVQQPD